MKELTNFLLQFGNLNQQQIELITSKAEELVLHKGEYFWETRKISEHVGFIINGILRVYYDNERGEETTSYFVEENHWLSDWENVDGSFIPVANLQAITNCKLIVFSKRDWNEISNTVIDLNYIIQKIIIKYKSEKFERRNSLVHENATERYLSFLEKYPNIVNRIPLFYIPSYLGIRQQTLSRIRKSIC